MNEENLPLHRKYRPKTLEDMVGNKATIHAIQKILDKGEKKPHSYLFTGPSGCGKTTLVRILREHLGCNELYFHEMNIGNTRGIDTIRELEDRAQYRPNIGESIVYFMDEAQMLTREAQNALLKLLEEPPDYLYIMLASTDPQKLIGTIHTRCTQFQVNPLTKRDMVKHLKNVAVSEGKVLDQEVAKKIASNSEGLARAGLVMLDQVIDLSSEEALKIVHTITAESPEIIELCRALFNNTPWAEIRELVKALGNEEAEAVRRAVLGYARTVLLGNDDGLKAAYVIECFADNYFSSGKAGLAASCYHTINIQ